MEERRILGCFNRKLHSPRCNEYGSQSIHPWIHLQIQSSSCCGNLERKCRGCFLQQRWTHKSRYHLLLLRRQGYVHLIYSEIPGFTHLLHRSYMEEQRWNEHRNLRLKSHQRHNFWNHRRLSQCRSRPHEPRVASHRLCRPNSHNYILRSRFAFLIHARLILLRSDYRIGRFTQCVTNYETDRVSYARPFHLYRSSTGAFTKVEIPFAINSVGRSQIVMDAFDNVYVILPYVRIVTASKSSGWKDWTLAYDGVSDGLNAFGEVTVDRARISSGVLSVLYQEKTSSGTNPSAVRIIDFTLNG